MIQSRSALAAESTDPRIVDIADEAAELLKIQSYRCNGVRSLLERLSASPLLSSGVLSGPELPDLIAESAGSYVIERSSWVVCTTQDEPNLIRSARFLGSVQVLHIHVESTGIAMAARVEAGRLQLGIRVAKAFFGVRHSALRQRILAAAAIAVADGLDAAGLASRLGVDRRMLTLLCSQSRLPAPRRLLAWYRVLFAAELLDRTDHSISSIARRCGYSHPTAFRDACFDLTGRTPSEIRALGAFRYALQQLQGETRPGRTRSSRANRSEA